MRLSAFLIRAGVFVVAAIAVVAVVWVFIGEKTMPANRIALIDGMIGGIFAALFTVLVALIAWEHLGSIARTSDAEFLLKLKDQFFKPETRNLFQLVDYGYLDFKHDKEAAWFKVNEDKVKTSGFPETIQTGLLLKRLYTTYEMDDLLLGHLEDIGLLYDNGTLRLDLIYEEFDAYLQATKKDEAVKAYLIWLGREGDDFYDKFKGVAEKSKEFGERKMRKQRARTG